jgi:cAMP-dependent protein kinase regulator
MMGRFRDFLVSLLCCKQNEAKANKNDSKQVTDITKKHNLNRNDNNDSDSDSDGSIISEKMNRMSIEKANVRKRSNAVFTKAYNPEFEDEHDMNNSFMSSTSDFENNMSKDVEAVKNTETKEKLRLILRSIVIFKHLYEDELNMIIDNMFQRKCKHNEVLIREGDDGNYFYVIEKGNYHIFKKTDSKTFDPSTKANVYGKKIGEYKNSGFFGELALLYNQPRSATIISMEDDGILWTLDRKSFQKLVISSAFKRRRMYEEFLGSVAILKDTMDEFERSQVADALTTIKFPKGSCIIKDGDSPNGMYFIEEGEVIISKEGQKGDKLLNVVLKKGDYFGEMALVNKTKRSASVYAHTDVCKVAFLDLEAFERLMGPCIDIIRRNINYRNILASKN